MTRKSSIPPPLTLGHIHDAIDAVCDQMNQKITGKYDEELQESSNIMTSFDSKNNNDIRSSIYQSNYRFRRVTELDEHIIMNKTSDARNEVLNDAYNNYDHVGTNNTKAGLLSEQKTTLSKLSKTIDMSRLHAIVDEFICSNHSTNNDDIIQKIYITTFYIAYSTWDGRVLHIDRFDIDDPNFYNNSDNDNTNHHNSRALLCETDFGVIIRRMVTKIAINLHCSRVVWQHDGIEPIYPGTIQPSTLHDMLTVHWYHDAMIQYIMKQQQQQIENYNNATMVMMPSFNEKSTKTILSHTEIKETINQCLHATQQMKSSSYLPPNGVTIRLATIDDVDVIGQLVKDLAIYVKEEDSINITTEYYKCDGFMTYPPLFYCFLLDYHDSSIDDSNATTTTFGMAFCYLGYTYKDGLYLYLEDLYIKESYRNNGCGKFVMYQLAYIALSLQCHHIVWGVLDWNKPSIQFYQNIGAYILPFNTYKTSRLVKHELESFSSLLY